MGAIVDFHSHILPAMDDGSKTPQESIAMLEMQKEQGIERVLATPHFDARVDTPEIFLKRREEAKAMLDSACFYCPGLPAVTLGAEVRYFPGMSHCEALEGLAIEGTKTILIEMPFTPWEESHYRELEGLHRKLGLLPVIAHVERYLGRFRSNGIPERLGGLPVLVQANGSFFLHLATAGKALGMLKKQQIHLLGSDCHDTEDRPPNLGMALKKIRSRLGEEALEHIGFWQNRVLGETM